MHRPPPSAYHASDGAAYERFLGRWTERLAIAFADFVRLPDAGEALDLGCGTGSLAAEIARRRPLSRVIGVDIAEPYVRYARERRTMANLTFERADASALAFVNDTFAATMAQLVLTFVPDARQVVTEMARVTRPGGVVAAAVWDFCGGLVYQRLFWDTAAVLDASAGRARDRLFSHPLSQPEALAELWRSAHLADVEIGSLTIRMDYSSFDDYWEPLLGGQGPVGTFVQSLDAALLERLRSAVRSSYLSGRPDGPRSLTATAWGVRGVVPRHRASSA
jgi:SAM-dependent methyltransferase